MKALYLKAQTRGDRQFDPNLGVGRQACKVEGAVIAPWGRAGSWRRVFAGSGRVAHAGLLSAAAREKGCRGV